MKFLNRQVLAEVQVYALYCIKLSLQRNNSRFKTGKCCYTRAYYSNWVFGLFRPLINIDFPLNIVNLLAQFLHDIEDI